MYKKILADLEKADPSNVAGVKSLLRRLHSDVQMCLKRSDRRGLQIISAAINAFLSANKSKFDIDRQNNPSNSYRIKAFLDELALIAERCEAV